MFRPAPRVFASGLETRDGASHRARVMSIVDPIRRSIGRFPLPPPRVPRGSVPPVRVLHVLPRVLDGGVERRRVTLVEKVGPEFEHRVVCLTGRGKVLEALEERGIDVKVCGTPTMFEPRAHLELHRAVRRWRPHILHGAIFEGMIWGGLAALTHRVPVLLLEETSHPDKSAPDGMRRSPKAQAAIRFVARRSAGVVAVAPTIGRYLTEDQRIPPNRVHVILNGIAEFELASREEALAERRRLGVDDDDFLIGAAARIHDAHKRFSDLMKALVTVRERQPRARLMLVGSGRDLEMLKELAQELGLGDAVVFTGRREDRHLFFAMMDAFALSSATEAAPLGLMEAMFAGLPCVSTIVGGVPDIATHEENALLVPRYQPPKLAEALLRLIEDDALRERLAHAAGERGRTHLTATRYAQDVRRLYLDSLAEAGISLPTD